MYIRPFTYALGRGEHFVISRFYHHGDGDGDRVYAGDYFLELAMEITVLCVAHSLDLVD